MTRIQRLLALGLGLETRYTISSTLLISDSAVSLFSLASLIHA